MSSGKLDNTKLLAIMIGSIVLVGVIGIVAIAIYAPADQSALLITTVTGFLGVIVTTVFNLFKTQTAIDASDELSKQLKFEGEEILSRAHRHKEVLLKGIEETKAVAIEAKEASKKAEHVANNVNEKIKNSLALRRDENRQQERQNDRLDNEDRRAKE